MKKQAEANASACTLTKVTRLSNYDMGVAREAVVWEPSKTTRLSNKSDKNLQSVPVWDLSKTTRLSNPTMVSPASGKVWEPSKTTRLSNWGEGGVSDYPVWEPSKITRLSNLKIWENAYKRVVFLDSNHTSKFKHHLKFVWKILLQMVNSSG